MNSSGNLKKFHREVFIVSYLLRVRNLLQNKFPKYFVPRQIFTIGDLFQYITQQFQKKKKRNFNSQILKMVLP